MFLISFCIVLDLHHSSIIKHHSSIIQTSSKHHSSSIQASSKHLSGIIQAGWCVIGDDSGGWNSHNTKSNNTKIILIIVLNPSVFEVDGSLDGSDFLTSFYNVLEMYFACFCNVLEIFFLIFCNALKMFFTLCCNGLDKLLTWFCNGL